MQDAVSVYRLSAGRCERGDERGVTQSRARLRHECRFHCQFEPAAFALADEHAVERRGHKRAGKVISVIFRGPVIATASGEDEGGEKHQERPPRCVQHSHPSCGSER